MMKIVAFAMVLFTASCSIITIERFVHKETDEILDTFYWTADKRTLGELISIEQNAPILVPDFNLYRSGRLLLRVITTSDTPIYFDRLVVESDVSSDIEERTINIASSPKQTRQGFWVDTVTISNIGHGDVFVGVKKVTLSVFWTDEKTNASTISTFDLIRTRKKDIAWVT